MEITQFMGHQEHEANDNSQEKKAGQPHEALFLIFAYLPLLELISISGVCRSLRDAVNKDVLPWMDVIVKAPLSSKLSDEILMKIALKANGRLRTLGLMNCEMITDDGLQRVIEQNHLINKLYLPGCTGLTPEGVIRAVKRLSENHLHGLKSLMINGIYNISKEHLETLRFYLPRNMSQREQLTSWPLLFHEYQDMPTFRHEEGHATIDVEVCPKCDEVRMVFDCPRTTCKREIERAISTDCRGCNICIQRCQECGGCVDSQETEEAVCADILCLDCWLQLPKCDFCNRPYCKQHSHKGSCPPGSTGFVCDACYARFVVNLQSVDD